MPVTGHIRTERKHFSVVPANAFDKLTRGRHSLNTSPSLDRGSGLAGEGVGPVLLEHNGCLRPQFGRFLRIATRRSYFCIGKPCWRGGAQRAPSHFSPPLQWRAKGGLVPATMTARSTVVQMLWRLLTLWMTCVLALPIALSSAATSIRSATRRASSGPG